MKIAIGRCCGMHKCMNWQAINFDWNQVRAFLATVEEGSLSAAARELGLTQPTLGRQVAGLEDRLGVTLFERGGRSLVLTPAGRQLVEHVRRMAEAATDVSLVASGQSTSVEGVVRITATEMYAANVLPPFAASLRRDHPGIVIEIVATNDVSNLRQREADIAIRNTDPKDPELIARRIMTERGGLFATSGLIAKYGPFKTLKDLAQAPFIGFGTETAGYLSALQAKGLPISESNFVSGSESHLVHWALARKGLGIGGNGLVLGDGFADMHRVSDGLLTFEFPVWLVAPSELRTNPRVRIVYDRLAETLGAMRHANSA